MKRISGIRKTTHKLLVKVVGDYFGGTADPEIIKSILGFKTELTEEQKADKWCIQQNLNDETYLTSFSL
jgi:hypothetical protein